MAKQTFTTGQVLTAAQMTSLQQTAMGGGSPTTKTTSYVLVAADAGTVIQMNSASSTTITVNTALFSAGDSVQIQNIGAGTCTITAGTATVNSAGSLGVTQYDGGFLYFSSASSAIWFDYTQAGTALPLTTKGDLFGYSTTNARIPVGSDTQVLTADSAQALGVKWSAAGMSNPLTTTGDTIYSSSGTTPARLGIGSTGQVLTVASGLPSWATPASGGKVLQVLQDTHTGAVSTSSTSFQDTNCTISITPSSASSKILVIANINGATKQSGNSANAVKLELLRGSTQVFATGDIVAWTGASNFATDCTTMVYLDSPATTSATTYKARFASTVSGQTANINYFNSSDTCMSSIVVMEIGA